MQNKSVKTISLLFSIMMVLLFSPETKAQKNAASFTDLKGLKTLKVKPSVADASVQQWDTASVIYYDPKIKNNKILLWLTGTNGTSNNVPVGFFKTALHQGYKVIALSFISNPGVSQVCIGKNLVSNPDCATEFRRKRIYGDQSFSGIPDQPQDAIIPRFVKLLEYLDKNDSEGKWGTYLEKEIKKPIWERIAIAGQSQGGGMAEFIGQYEHLDRIISFSGGWDYSYSKEKKIADWYLRKNVTPITKWFATYHIKELAAASLKEICTALKIPEDQTFPLDKPLFNPAAINKQNPYHVDGIRNPAYQQIWITMLGSGI